MRSLPHLPAARRLRIGVPLTLATTAALLCSATPALADVTITSPRANAPVQAGKTAVGLRVTGVVRNLTVHAAGKDITKSLRGAAERTTVITTKPGWNRVDVTWRDAKGGRHRIGRGFTAGRRNPKLLHIVGAPSRSEGLIRLKVKVARGVTNAVVSVNGKRTPLPPTGGIPRTVRLELGTRQGVRFGVDTITVESEVPDRKQYDKDTVTVNVPRTRPIAGGISRFDGVARRPMHLDARQVVPSQPGAKVSYRWVVASKPAGAKVKLLAANTARPRITADRPGRYRLRLVLTEHGRASAARTTTQLVTMVNAPAPVPSAGLWLQGGASYSGVSLGGTQYAAQGGDGPMLLVLDATNLAPLNVTGNTMVLPDGPVAYVAPGIPLGSDADQSILSALQGVGSLTDDPMIVVIASTLPAEGDPFTSSLISGSTNATYLFAYDSTKSDYGLSSGWSSVSENAQDVGDGQLNGWLTQGYVNGSGISSASGIFTFRPGPQVPFDTQASTAAGSNTMTIGGTTATAGLPNGATDGFQFVAIDPLAGNGILFNRAFASNDPQQMTQLSQAINLFAGYPNALLLMQSIGAPVPTDAGWDAAADQIAALGGVSGGLVGLANTPGGYAFVATVGVDAANPTQHPAGQTGSTTVEATPVQDSPLKSAASRADKQLTGYLLRTQHGGLMPGSTAQYDNTETGVYGALADAPPNAYDQFTDPNEQAVLQAMSQFQGSGVASAFDSSCYPGVTDITQLSLAEQVRGSFCNTAAAGAASTIAAQMGDWANGNTPLPGYTGPESALISVASELNIEFTAVAAIDGFQDFRTAIETAETDPKTGAAALSAVVSQVTQPANHSNALLNDSETLTNDLLAFVDTSDPAAYSVTLLGSIGYFANTMLDKFDKSTPANPVPTQVDPNDLVSFAASQLEAMDAGLQAAVDRYSADPYKLLRAQNNIFGHTQTPVPNDRFPQFTADWSITAGNSQAFVDVWAQTMQTQMGTAYVGAAYKAFTLPVVISGTAFLPSKGPDMLACEYPMGHGEEDWYEPYNGAPAGTAWVPRDHWASTQVWTLWMHSAPETGPMQVAITSNNAGFQISQNLWNQLIGTGSGQWAIPPTALFQSSGATPVTAISEQTLQQLQQGCTWSN